MKDNYAKRLVGHRGQMATHPENALSGYRAAIAGGATIVECDVQLTKDKVPVVLHDHGLSRTACEGIDGTIFDHDWADACQFSVHQGQKFEQKYYPEPLPSLEQFFDLLKCHPKVTAMVELKQESIDHFDLPSFLNVVFPQARLCKEQVIIISFNADVIRQAIEAGFVTGWVIDKMDDAAKAIAMEMLPPYLITDVLEVDVQNPDLWQAPTGHSWQWMLYDVVDPVVVQSLMDKGVDLIETADVVALVEHFNSEQS